VTAPQPELRLMLGTATLRIPAVQAAQFDENGWPDDELLIEIAERHGWLEDQPPSPPT
jgi:hypothetical protein